MSTPLGLPTNEPSEYSGSVFYLNVALPSIPTCSILVLYLNSFPKNIHVHRHKICNWRLHLLLFNLHRCLTVLPPVAT